MIGEPVVGILALILANLLQKSFEIPLVEEGGSHQTVQIPETSNTIQPRKLIDENWIGDKVVPALLVDVEKYFEHFTGLQSVELAADLIVRIEQSA